MTDSSIQYLTDHQGNPSAVVIPIDLWRKIFFEDQTSAEIITERIEDYCLNRAMDEALNTKLLSHSEALKFLEDPDEDWI